MMRLDKFLSDAGLGSRAQVKDLLKKKQVLVNGKLEKSPKAQINEQEDQVQVSGQLVTYEKFVYYVLNKPKGVLTARQDPERKTVLDLLDASAFDKGVSPVGRLDLNTHGLLLLTNNGQLSHAMLSPKKHVSKLYRAHVNGIMDEEDVERFAQGIEFKEFTSLPAQLEIVEVDEENHRCIVEIRLSEGKFHQVKRMVQACGKNVTDLQRLTMGPLSLDPALEPGDYRRLTDQEMASLEIFDVEL